MNISKTEMESIAFCLPTEPTETINTIKPQQTTTPCPVCGEFLKLHSQKEMLFECSFCGLWNFDGKEWTPVDLGFHVLQNEKEMLFDCSVCIEEKEEDKYNAERIVKCVNACDGIEHPEHLQEVLTAAKTLLSNYKSFQASDCATDLKKALRKLTFNKEGEEQ